MSEDVDELLLAANTCKQNGWMKAAAILGREGAERIRATRRPRKKGVKVRLIGGGFAVLDKVLVDRAEEWNEGD
jgi:hypothetical protein